MVDMSHLKCYCCCSQARCAHTDIHILMRSYHVSAMCCYHPLCFCCAPLHQPLRPPCHRQPPPQRRLLISCCGACSRTAARCTRPMSWRSLMHTRTVTSELKVKHITHVRGSVLLPLWAFVTQPDALPTFRFRLRILLETTVAFIALRYSTCCAA